MSARRSRVGIVCGGSVCPICGRDTVVLFGPCEDCCEYHVRTGKFPRRRKAAS